MKREKDAYSLLCVRFILFSLTIFLLAAFVSAAPEDGLLLRYNFDNATATDTSGNNRHGTIIGTTSTSSGKVNGAYSFDGVDDQVVVSGNWVPQGNGTLLFWINQTRTGVQQRVLGSDDAYEVVLTAGNVLSNQIYRSLEVVNPSWPLAANTWYHVGMTWDKKAGTVKTYINGQLNFSATDTDGLPPIGTLRLGYRTGASSANYFGGLLDELKIYDRELTAQEIADDYNPPVPVADTDGDGVADSADNCPTVSNAAQTNTDGDAYGDACDSDDDADGIADITDNCPLVSNFAQTNTDGDAQGDACDADDDNDGVLDVDDCAGGSKVCSATELCQNSVCVADTDADGVADTTDNCPTTSNPSQTNLDGDTQGDACDTDDDNDGVLDVNDCAGGSKVCTATELCQNSVCVADTDGDGVANSSDNCPSTSNAAQLDTDADGQGDACDCGDGLLVVGEQCDAGTSNGLVCTANYESSCTYCTSSCQQQTVVGGSCGDLMVNGLEECDGTPDCTTTCKKDTDADGVLDATDNCPLVSNFAQTNTDGDAQGDACDADDDNDGVTDASDNCPVLENAGQLDTDADGQGDACDSDDDNDTVPDATDNCPLASNAAQTDTDADGRGDACDSDDDNDGVLDRNDPAPLDAAVCGDADADSCDDCGVDEVVDADADNFCNLGDVDDDNDGILDASDAQPTNANACGDSDLDSCDDCGVAGTWAPLNDGVDSDADGICDAGEVVVDLDADNDGVADASDSNPSLATACSDTERDTCDDCSSGTFNPRNDGTDTDGDGLCDLGDDDKDGDTVVNVLDKDPLNAQVCLDIDGDTCDDCSIAGSLAPNNDGTDTDADGWCDAGDSDANGDGIRDPTVTAPCGNGKIDTGEQCDDGYTTDGDGCSATCTRETLQTVAASAWESSVTQPVPSGASITRLRLPASIERIAVKKIGPFGAHQGGHIEGLDHEWIEVKNDAPIMSWADATVTTVKKVNSNDPNSNWRVTLSFDDGLYGEFMNLRTSLVQEGQHLNAGDPVGWGGTILGSGYQDGEFNLADAHRSDGVKAYTTRSVPAAFVSPFDYLLDGPKQDLITAYQQQVEPSLIAGSSVETWKLWEPYFTNRMLLHGNNPDTLIGEWYLHDKAKADDGIPDKLTFLLTSVYYNKQRVLAADSNNLFEKDWAVVTAAEDQGCQPPAGAQCVQFIDDPTKPDALGTLYGLFTIDESTPRATLRLEYQQGTYPTAFSAAANVYIERDAGWE